MNHQISCIICTHNEAPRIGDVLKVVANHPLLKEVIVVDDGSTDGTAEELKKKFPSVRLISYSPNRGKTRALMTGAEAAKGDIIMMIDADLSHITPQNITDLAEPVLSGSAQMSISLRKNSLPLFRWIGLDFVSGERVINKSILKDKATIEALPPFGIESYINAQIIAQKGKIAIVRWDNVIHNRKMKKMGWWKGRWGEMKTILDVLKVLSPLKIWRQNSAMLTLSRKSRVPNGK